MRNIWINTLITIALMNLVFLTYAQLPKVDSLEQLINNEKVMAGQRVQAMIELARLQMPVSTSQSIETAKNALILAEKIADKKLMADATKEIAKGFYRQSDLANALEYFKLALKINIEINHTTELAASYNNVGVVYNRLGYYDLALQNHLNQLKINEENGNQRGIAISHLNIGNIYENLNDYDKAREQYLKSGEMHRALSDSNSYSNTSINLGVVSMKLKEFEKARGFFNEALAIKEKDGDMINIAAIYTNLGVINLSENNLTGALRYFEMSRAIYDSIDNRQGVAAALLNIGEVKLRLKRFEESYALFSDALRIAQEIDSRKLILDAKSYLVKWFETTGDFGQAYEYFTAVTVLKDSLLNSEKSLQIKNLQIVYEVEKKEKEILEQSIAIERLKSRQFYFWMIILAVFVLAATLFWMYRIKKRLNRQLELRIEEALKKQNEQQQVIVHQSSLTSLGELASGIAHEIKQPLQNISLAVESIQLENQEDAPDRNFISQSIKDIHEDIKRIKLIISEISKFSRGQQMMIQEPFDFNEGIEKAFILARTKFSDYQIKVEFDLDRTIPEVLGNPYKFEQVVVNFFNNAKDAIEEQAARSEGSFEKLMKVRSCQDKHFISLEVSDNGIGIPEQLKTNIFLPFYTTKSLGKGTGLGLSISLGIAKEMGGFIEVESEEGKGTLMRLKIPQPKKID